MKIEYHPALEAELEEIRDYYDERSQGLGIAFVDEFERQVLAIATMPTRWMIVERDIRPALMKRFPDRTGIANKSTRIAGAIDWMRSKGISP